MQIQTPRRDSSRFVECRLELSGMWRRWPRAFRRPFGSAIAIGLRPASDVIATVPFHAVGSDGTTRRQTIVPSFCLGSQEPRVTPTRITESSCSIMNCVSPAFFTRISDFLGYSCAPFFHSRRRAQVWAVSCIFVTFLHFPAAAGATPSANFCRRSGSWRNASSGAASKNPSAQCQANFAYRCLFYESFSPRPLTRPRVCRDHFGAAAPRPAEQRIKTGNHHFRPVIPGLIGLQ